MSFLFRENFGMRWDKWQINFFESARQYCRYLTMSSKRKNITIQRQAIVLEKSGYFRQI